MTTVLFHSNQCSLRGTEVALYDYAHYNETLLGNRSYVVFPLAAKSEPEAMAKFEARFTVYYYRDRADLRTYAESIRADVFYAIKSGKNDGLTIPGKKNVVHVVFMKNDPHGDVYAYISRWLAHRMTRGVSPFVPHMVHLPQDGGHLRAELGIPQNAIVFGRYGGWETFDIPYVHEAVLRVARSHPDRYFLFMNTRPFSDSKPSNIVYLPGTSDPLEKVKFINTCDAMLHARMQGESFGLACGEFSIRNKPVLTCAHRSVRERCHIELLGRKGLYYKGPWSLNRLLTGFRPRPEKDWDAYTREFSPGVVMEQFERVFLT